MRFLPLPLPSNKTIALGEVSAEDEPYFRYLMALLREKQKGMGDDPFMIGSPEIIEILKEIAPLVPLLPLRHAKYFAIDDLLHPSIDIPVLGWLFWGDECQILKLNEPDPVKETKKNDDITIETVPIKSSGDDTADVFASILSVDNSVVGAQILMRQYSARFLNNVIQQLNERRADPQERVNDVMEASLKNFIDERTQDEDGAIDPFKLAGFYSVDS